MQEGGSAHGGTGAVQWRGDENPNSHSAPVGCAAGAGARAARRVCDAGCAARRRRLLLDDPKCGGDSWVRSDLAPSAILGARSCTLRILLWLDVDRRLDERLFVAGAEPRRRSTALASDAGSGRTLDRSASAFARTSTSFLIGRTHRPRGPPSARMLGIESVRASLVRRDTYTIRKESP